MASKRILAGVVSVFSLSASVLLAAEPYKATIVAPTVEVRSGPSPQYYATSELRRGTQVTVVGKENGWLAIAPPAPDSFSWVSYQAVEKRGVTAVVIADQTRLRVGSLFHKDTPNVEQGTVRRGYQLTVIGPA